MPKQRQRAPSVEPTASSTGPSAHDLTGGQGNAAMAEAMQQRNQLGSGLLKDDWDTMSNEQIQLSDILDRDDLVLHYNNPLIASYVLPDSWVKTLVEQWEAFEVWASDLGVDATDIFAGYAAIRGEPNLHPRTIPEMFKTLEDFYAAYPQLRDADVHGEEVGKILARYQREPQQPTEEEPGSGLDEILGDTNLAP